mgnify:CR=1 FL=1
MIDGHISCALHIEQDRLWDAIEDRLKEWAHLHIDELVSDAMIGFEKDLEYIVDGAFKRAENNFNNRLNYTMEELEATLKETKDE